jgi:hypothetical protein
VASAVENPAVLETADGVGLLHQLRIEIDELHSVNQHATEWMTEIAEIAAGLSADVARLRASISAERVFAPAVEHCCDVLRRLKARIIVEAGPVERSALLGFEQQYTMRAEREVHEAVLKSAEPARGTPSARAQTAAPVTTPDFGENVELF